MKIILLVVLILAGCQGEMKEDHSRPVSTPTSDKGSLIEHIEGLQKK